MKKELYVIEALNCVVFYNQLTKETLEKLPLKLSWSLKRAIDKMRPDVQAFEEFRDKELNKIKDVYFNDEYSEVSTRQATKEDGSLLFDEDNNPVMEEVRKIKDEHLAEYRKEIDELNKKLEPILMEKNIYEYNGYNIDEFVNSLPDDTDIDFSVLEEINTILGEA